MLRARAILFDIDGTLVDSTPVVERSWRTWAQEHGVDADEVLRVCHGRRTEDTVAEFGKNVPMKRPGQPAELATAYVMLADPLSSYVSGATIAVTGGQPIL